MTMAEKQEQMAEAIKRIMLLTEKYDLTPNLLKYYKEGKIYYTESIIPGIWASMDNITYDNKYVELVKRFEQEYNVHVYHCIKTGMLFDMLYVSSHEDEWEVQRPDPKTDWLMAATYNPEYDDFDFGDIQLSVASHTLIRVG